jgi:hypothetical protein
MARGVLCKRGADPASRVAAMIQENADEFIANLR